MDFAKNRYVVIRNAISRELADFCYFYFLNKRSVAKTLHNHNQLHLYGSTFGSWNDSQVPQTYSHYSDIVMETLLLKVKPVMEKHTNLKLVETYSYARIYKKGDILHRHKDRPSCEISTTMNLGGPLWPIYIEPDPSKGHIENGKYISENTKGVEVILNPGDMLVYRGCELEHWRESFDSQDCAQVFLHYNDATNPNALVNKFDTRPHLGLPTNFRQTS